MDYNDLIERSALGAAAGLVGTLAIQVMRTSNQKLLPETMPPIREDPGAFMVEQAEELLPEQAQDDIPDFAEAAAAKALAMGYGMTAGALLGALRSDEGNVVVDGVVLALGTWAVGYLGWLPASGLMPPLTKQTPEQVLAVAVQHALFGIVTASIYQWLHNC
jgi:hypothetical protein